MRSHGSYTKPTLKQLQRNRHGSITYIVETDTMWIVGRCKYSLFGSMHCINCGKYRGDETVGYGNLLAALRAGGDSARAGTVARRLALLDLLAGDRNAAGAHLDAYRAAGGQAVSPGTPPEANSPADQGTANIPGPLRSFARMAALSPDADLADVLPALARNVVTNGYQASHNNESLEQTEYLKLVHRYLSQARELEKLSGETRTIKIDTCESPTAGELLRILGFRMRGGCGSEVVLETVNAPRAFLTTDSGFPLNDLEQALRTNHPFI